ncbi:MAG: 16S rRNA (guanine(966)-N(2))-methyltransferase RsmD [Candidatus Binataceae bacterium]
MRVIAGKAHGRRLTAPRGLATRPTSARARESIFSRLAVRIDLDGARVLDIFAGSGSLGLEALSRGAAHVTFVDSSRAAAAAIRKNLESIGAAERARVMVAEMRRALAELSESGGQFDLVFVDAPYKNDLSAEVVATVAGGNLVAPGGYVVVEQSKRALGPPAAAATFMLANAATIGDHRIALYRRLGAAPAAE